ncbi:hypothetical protein fugu_009634 [Takifugu bimaculatus]|uniref:Myotubularin phosphatase domain-containing protein n=1 Tax=Takifugu bimaculatus TaxID=433685 RepID=A0A4Z2CD46_9TELE|nr:hypothetical protein fugu_009634 [Takifugu bimaculatus]
MLTGSKTTFKVRQMLPDMKERMLNQSGGNSRARDVFGLRCLPGECVLQRAVMVRKKLTAREGRGWLAGTLLCTHFRVAFVPEDSPKPDDNADPVLLGDHDVALASIEKVVVVGPNRTKVVTPNSSLKFTPEELLLYCRDLRVVCFLFDRLTPDAQVIEITYTIARTYQPPKPGSVLSFQNAALGSVEMKQFLSNRRREAHMNWFESATDWEQELDRCGATGWRVSSVNDRFEMSTRNLELILFGCQSSLCVVVELGDELPSPTDIQLAHSRLRALCLGDISTSVSVPDDKWLSTLESTHWLDYIRSCLKKASEVACLLRGGHLTVALQEADDRDMSCVVSSLVQVMCDPQCRTQHGFQGLVQKEWVMAGHRFYSRMNYHRDNDKEEAPVFLLFLDCVWQLLSQYPSHFQLTGDFLLALHDSIHLPLFSSFMANCQRERCKRSQVKVTSGSHTPQVNGWRDTLHPDALADLSDPPLPPVWDWALQYSKHRRDHFTQPVSPVPPLQPLLNGNLNTNPDTLRLLDSITGSVFLFSHGTFSCPANLLPWRSSSSGVYKKSHRRVASSENVPGLERLLKAWNLTESPQGLVLRSAHQGQLDPHEPLIPLLMGPCMGLWRECYLRGALHAQAFSHPVSANHPHPMEQLTQELQQLKDKLAQVSRNSSLSSKNGEHKQSDDNLNQNAGDGTFLFRAPRTAGVPAPRPAASLTSTSFQNSKSPPYTSTQKDKSGSKKHTFLFGHSSAAP